MPRLALHTFFPLLILLHGLSSCWPSALQAGEKLAPVWTLVARHLPGDAAAELGTAKSARSRETEFAQAVILMDSQPVTEAKLQQVEQQLATLARGDDEIACASGYLIGRLYQVHFPKHDPGRAAAEFEHLAATHATSYWAQLGLVKLALLRLYAQPEPAEPTARIAAAEAILPRLTAPELRRDLHIVLGRARLFHGLPGVLDHLLAGERIGGLTNVPRADLQLQIAELSRRDGNWEQAHFFFQRFLDENEVDARAYQVKLKLAEIAPHLRARKAAP